MYMYVVYNRNSISEVIVLAIVYYLESIDHSMLSEYSINKVSLYFFQFQYTLMWVGIELYSKVGKCLQLNCFPLLSVIFYLLFEGIIQII